MTPLTPTALRRFFAARSHDQWFTGGDRTIDNVEVLADVALAPGLRLALLEVRYQDGERETYHAPLAVSAEPGGAVGDGLDDPRCARDIVAAIRGGASLGGEIVGVPTTGAAIPDVERSAVCRIGGPQSNSALRLGDDVLLKVLRKPERGVSIEREMGAYLAARGYANTPRLLGALAFQDMTLALAFQYVASGGDGWSRALAHLAAGAADTLVEDAALLGRRLGELHAALGAETSDDAFLPAPIARADLDAWAAALRREVDDTIAVAERAAPNVIAALSAARAGLLTRADTLRRVEPSGMKTRIHGDLHLGQMLVRNGDFLVLDFEGEPARPKEERRAKFTPLRDVAGMVRSFAYAAAESSRRGVDVPSGLAERASAALVDAHRRTLAATSLLPSTSATFDALLSYCELQKALYEVRYELAHRPAWVAIPLARVVELAGAVS
ncbi:MAG: phosphotransferase [Deltaproteobacteria bacterium]|nr:phosphotransferase [Deltaproteobacteria bacterium]